MKNKTIKGEKIIAKHLIRKAGCYMAIIETKQGMLVPVLYTINGLCVKKIYSKSNIKRK
ncbi:MAG: hypothetical protein ABI241_00670 [Bacteroidia bacterium]